MVKKEKDKKTKQNTYRRDYAEESNPPLWGPRIFLHLSMQ